MFLSGETEYPRRATYRAATRVFSRVFIMYFFIVFILTLIVSSRNPLIASSSGNATSSPFVVAIKAAGIKVLPHMVNGVVLTSALSAASLQIMKALRSVYALASKGQAPKVVMKTNKKGLPYIAVGCACFFLPLAYLSVNTASSNVFSWFQALGSSNVLITWILISVNHILMTRAMKVQGYSRDQLPYKFRLGLFGSWFSLIGSIIFLLTGGFTVFIKGHWEFSKFFTSYVVIPIALALFTFWKVFKKTTFIKPEDVNLKALFKDVEDKPEPPYEKLTGWRTITVIWA